MFIKISHDKMRSLDAEYLIQEACDLLSSQGVQNYFHRYTSRLVELNKTKELRLPVVDYASGGIWLKCC